METLRYSVTINAPVQDVWTTMLNDATYREWTSVFNSDSYYEGARLADDGQDPTVVLDGTPESLVPLWRWMLPRLTRVDDPGATDPASVPRERWPSWERYTAEKERTLSLESLTLLDGLVSYLAEVVQDCVPSARWDVARHSHERHAYNNHPVLVSGKGEDHNFLPGLPVVSARAALRSSLESPDDAMAAYARRLIDRLKDVDGGTAETVEPEPPFEVEEVRDEPGGYDFEIGLSDEIAHVYSLKVDWLVRRLSSKAGILEAYREDREVILVRAPSWSAGQLESWLAPRFRKGWISAVMRKIRQE